MIRDLQEPPITFLYIGDTDTQECAYSAASRKLAEIMWGLAPSVDQLENGASRRYEDGVTRSLAVAAARNRSRGDMHCAVILQ